ncbi:Phosphatidic acid phosphatase type 2/haloperoxidase [Dillenia turbinata]|uniref:Phosphatidic acid phosphatase type 2/haloperoxidase n=1 Tax=Dillenia turbinata TaxID=194707 RepID=A0AAN8UYR2_9MAGN
MAWRDMLSLCSFPNLRNMFQGRMREVDLGAYTIKSHGASLAKNHKHDWLILLLLAAIEITLYSIQPFRRYVGKDMMADLKYPMKSDTVPAWAVPLYAVLLPIGVFILFYVRRRDVYDLHHSILGLLFAVLIAGVLTDAIKDAVGRPRPDFFWRCFPDGRDDYDALGNVICHGKESVVKEGYKSFPSGHTSWSFAGLGFLSFYLSGKIKAFDRKGHIAKLCILFLPLLIASLVGVSRVDDYWHHWQDVFAGGLLGFVVAGFCYLQFFPPPYSTDGWAPYAYFQVIEDSNAQRPNNHTNMNVPNVEAAAAQDGQNSSSYRPSSAEKDYNSSLEVMESGSWNKTRENKMPEILLGGHTVRSHGTTVLRRHVHDWLILVLLAVIDVVLNVIEPFHRFVGENMMEDLTYPLKDNTVPFWAVPILGVVLPLAIILAYYFIRRDVYDLHHAILGLLFSTFLTLVITDAIKDAVGRPRPNFFWRCFPDGKGVYDPITKNVMCTGVKAVIKEGHKSFPSGHTSCSFAGLGFLALYLSGKIQAFDSRGHVAKLCIVFLPLLVAALVGISRVDDYWHHWQDVFAGGLIGLIIASFCYLQFFPPPYHIDGWGPHAYFQVLAERNGTQASPITTNHLTIQPSQTGSPYYDSPGGNETTSITNNDDTNSILNSMENGRRRY